MSSAFATIADAVKLALSAARVATTLSLDFDIERKYIAMEQESDLTTLTLTVVPVEADYQQSERSRKMVDLDLGILIQKKIGTSAKPESSVAADVTNTNTEIDALLQFAEEVAKLWKPGSPALTSAQWVSTKHSPIYDVQKLRELRIFESLVILKFKYQAT